MSLHFGRQAMERRRRPVGKGLHMQMDGNQGSGRPLWKAGEGGGGEDGSADFVFEDFLGFVGIAG